MGLFFFVFVFTFVKEGTAKAIKKFGQFYKIIYSYNDHAKDVDDNIVPEKGKGGAFLGGLKFVGIRFIHTIDRRDFNWMAWEQMEKDGKIEDRPIPKKVKNMDYILLQDDIYYAMLDKVECANMVPLNVALLLRAKITNPKKARFRVQNWYEAMINLVKPAARLWVGTKTYKELTSNDTGILAALFEYLSQIREQLKNDYGVDLLSVGIGTIDPASELAKQFIEASTKEYLAEQEKKSITTLADAEVERVEKVYSKIKEHGPAGMQIRALESIDKAGKGEGNWIIPFGSIQQLLEGLTGKKGGNK